MGQVEPEPRTQGSAAEVQTMAVFSIFFVLITVILLSLYNVGVQPPL